MRDKEVAENRPRKARLRERARHERRSPNSPRRAGCKQLHGGRGSAPLRGGAPGFAAAGFGVFGGPAGGHANGSQKT